MRPRAAFLPLLVAATVLVRGAWAAAPIFENRTPVAFATEDSSARSAVVAGQPVTVRVDLNQAASQAYPVVGDFQALERSRQLGSTATDGMQVDVAASVSVPMGHAPAGQAALHMAWIEQAGYSQGRSYNGGITPVYRVMYARSTDGGATFSTPASVCGLVTYHLQTADGNGGSFSTLDLEVDSGGRPRIAYAFVSTADHRRSRNVYLAYSQDGGGSWQTPLAVNDAATVGADVVGRRQAAFPRLAIDDRDEVYLTYVRGSSRGGGTDDIMLAKVNRQTWPFTMAAIGSSGSVGTGGVRVTPDAKRATGPDLKPGDGDVLHLIYYNDTDNRIEHRCLSGADHWAEAGAAGWNQDAVGALVSTFVNEAAANAALESDARWFFPAIAVDRLRTPDRVYALFKYGDATPAEGIRWNRYDDDGSRGTSATWGTASSIWADGLFADGAGQWNAELDWEITERVAVLIDQRPNDRGDLHLVFSAGYSGRGEHDLYYAYGNGSSWSLPEKVADDDADGSGTEDGIDNADTYLLSPSLAMLTGGTNLFLGFAGGAGEGVGVNGLNQVDHHAYLKVLGRQVAWQDQSVPAGGYQYDLTYTPVYPHAVASFAGTRAVWVHAADPADGAGLGASGGSTDAFLAGDWESVATTLGDDDKYYEGRVDEDPLSSHEWGDDGDKAGLLVKLNVLGSDSATNLQVVTGSTASAAGTGLGARTVRVGSDPRGAVTAVGRYFALGAAIDIVAANTAPVVSLTQPDGVGDEANTEYLIEYSAVDADDNLGANLRLALYAYPSPALTSVQDIRIFGFLVADENDVPTVNTAGTGDLTEGLHQSYTWDEPPAALRQDALFASILRLPSGPYWIYLVADDGRNSPVFAVSSGAVVLRHAPLVRQVDPTAPDTVDTGIRSGLQANPFDLDFAVVDYDSEARVQLFYAAAAGITSVSARGTWPRPSFVLGRSVSGLRGTAITDSATLTGRDTQILWDVSSPLIPAGSYYLYAVASDSSSTTVGCSTHPLVVRHSPSFVFYEPARDTQREFDSGSQPVYTFQWQKGPGDQDLDQNARIGLYFTTDDPAVADHATAAGAAPSALVNDADTRLIVDGLTEDPDGAADMYAWDLRQAAGAIPVSGTRVWVYAMLTDASGDTTVARGGALLIRHTPQVLLTTALPAISQGDLVRLEWDDYLVDDGVGTDNAYLRLYASASPDHSDLASLEAGLQLATGAGATWLVNSDDGTAAGSIYPIREDSSKAFTWRTRTPGWVLPTGSYYVYAGVSGDATFGNGGSGRVSRSAEPLLVGTGSGTTPHLSLSPSQVRAAVGDTLTFQVLAQSGSQAAGAVSVAIDLGSSALSVVSPTAPFADAGQVLTAGTVVENVANGSQLRFTKTQAGPVVIGAPYAQLLLATFRVVVGDAFSGRAILSFDSERTGLTLAGSGVALTRSTGLSVQQAQVQAITRGRIAARVLLEGRAAPLGNGDHAALLDVHLRLPGSCVDIDDARFRLANDAVLASADTVQVRTTSDGSLTLYSVPPGRYVLAVKDSSHLSGRTDTLVVRAGVTWVLGPEHGLFASDLRGDASFLLDQDGRLLKAGDANGDNEIDEDDINAIDAAWGTDGAATGFARADVNNDGRVGVEDLTVAASNIGNSDGFGAPPVYRSMAGDTPPRVRLEATPDPETLPAGAEFDLVATVEGAHALAGYDLQWEYDPARLQVWPAGPGEGAIFAASPQGSWRRQSQADRRVTVASARYGRGWSATGNGELLRLRARLTVPGRRTDVGQITGRLLAADYTAIAVRAGATAAAIPLDPAIGPAFPNPFNPQTTVPFAVPVLAADAPVSLEVFDTLGQRLRQLVAGPLAPGAHQVVWDGCDASGRPAASGVYLARLRVGNTCRVTRLVLLR